MILFRVFFVWKKGKEHCITDGLSRALVNNPNDDENHDDDHRIATISAVRIAIIDDDQNDEDFHDGKLIDPVLKDIRRAAKNDPDYAALVKGIENDFVDFVKATPFIRQFRVIRHELAVEDGLVLYDPRLVIPTAK